MASKYMIHACPKRMWYVENHLVQSMVKQGISISDIEIWNDAEGKGNLVSCIESFEECGKREGGTWHLQDDVIICRNFAERTREITDGIVAGFIHKRFNENYGKIGMQKAKELWYSFPCIHIPNKLAGEFVMWFKNDASQRTCNVQKVAANKSDDWFWIDFLREKHEDMNVTNLKPNLVDHVDFLLGGSILNPDRTSEKTRAYYFEDEDLVDELARILGKIE